MAFDTFTPPLAPAPQATQSTSTPRVITNSYGGYKADLREGLFGAEQAVTLAWNPIRREDADKICQFLDAHQRAPFFYTLPRETEPRVWRWTGWQRSYPHPIYDALVVTIEEKFSP